MAASTLAVDVALQLNLVPSPGAPVQARPGLTFAGSYKKRSDDRYELTGSGTKTVDFAGIPSAGAKVLVVFYEAGTAVIELDLGTDTLELSQGGFIVYTNPVPANGLDALSIVHTADATVQVLVLG